MPHIGSFRRAQRGAAAALAGHPDVTSVGVGMRHERGVCTGELCFVVSVERKGRPTGPVLGPYLTLPSGSWRIDVREAPAASLTLVNARLGGADVIVSTAAAGRFGTLGVIAPRTGTTALLAMTCSHVVSAPGASAVGADVVANVNGAQTVIGDVAHQTTLSSAGGAVADLALVALNAAGRQAADTFRIESVSDVIAGSLPLSASLSGGGARPHFYVAKAGGVAQRFVCERFAELPGVVMRDAQSGTHVPFGRAFQFEVRGGAGVEAGHSAALLVRETASGRLAAVGLLFAGRGGVGYAFSWTEISRALASFGVSLG